MTLRANIVNPPKKKTAEERLMDAAYIDPNSPSVVTTDKPSKDTIKKFEDIYKDAARRLGEKQATAVPSTTTIDKPVIVRGDKGGVTGLNFPDNPDIMGSPWVRGLPPGHAEKLLDIYNQRLGMFEGADEAEDIRKRIKAEREKEKQAEQVGEGYNPAQASLMGAGMPEGQVGLFGVSDIDMQQAFTSSLLDGILGGIGASVTTAVAGATLGSRTGIPQLAVLGGITGFAFGLANGIKKNIASQRSDTISAQQKTLTDSRENLNKLIEIIKLYPANAEEYISDYNQQLNQIAIAYQNLKLDTQSDLNKALSKDGTVALQEFENFYAAGGRKEVLDLKMKAAVLNPDPNDALKNLLISELNIGE